jgi:hypothetical protein
LENRFKTVCNFFAEMSCDLTRRRDSAKKHRFNAALPPMRIIRGIFAMSSVDQVSLQSDGATERKRWETPTVILGSARRRTQSNVNTAGVDGIATTGSSYGS